MIKPLHHGLQNW